MKIIVVDPGHGGKNHGTEDTARAFYEKQWTLDFVEQFLTNALADEAADHGKELVLVQTRHSDQDLSLSQRAEISDRVNADLVISVHVNASDNTGARGLITFVNRSELLQAAQQITKNVPPALARKVGFYDMSRVENIKAWPRVYNVLHGHSCPAMLIECGFRTNAADFALLQDNIVKARLAHAISEALVENL